MSDEGNTQVETPKDLREARDRAIERASEAEATATAAVQELRQFKAETLFGDTKHAELFLKANPEADVTAEAVSDFRSEYGLVQDEPHPRLKTTVLIPEQGWKVSETPLAQARAEALPQRSRRCRRRISISFSLRIHRRPLRHT